MKYFNHKYSVLMTFVDQFNAKGDLLMERLRSFGDGLTIVNLSDEFNHAALDAIALIAFGMNIGVQTNIATACKFILVLRHFVTVCFLLQFIRAYCAHPTAGFHG